MLSCQTFFQLQNGLNEVLFFLLLFFFSFFFFFFFFGGGGGGGGVVYQFHIISENAIFENCVKHLSFEKKSNVCCFYDG